jgi:hypothetical protein
MNIHQVRDYAENTIRTTALSSAIFSENSILPNILVFRKYIKKEIFITVGFKEVQNSVDVSQIRTYCL